MTNLTLNQKLAAIGFRITSPDIRHRPKGLPVDIEQVLIQAILESDGDGRLASLIFSWLKVHGAYVNVERLAKLARLWPEHTHPTIRLLSVYAAFALEHCGQKWKKLIRRTKEPIYLYPKEITESALKIKGAVDYLEKYGFIVPNGAIRIREEDTLSRVELISINAWYRNRYLYGPSWRADIISAIESGARTPAEVVRVIGCSYEPAHRVFWEYRLAKAG